MLDSATIAAFVGALPENVTTVIDEAYMEFVEGAPSSVNLVTGPKRVVVLRTFSKLHGMAGVRCGYGIARPEIIEEIAEGRFRECELRFREGPPRVFLFGHGAHLRQQGCHFGGGRRLRRRLVARITQ